jgi:hypothetical protein
MMNQDQPSTEDWCGRFWNGMELLKDVTEKKHFLPTGLEGYSYLKHNRALYSSLTILDPCQDSLLIE